MQKELQTRIITAAVLIAALIGFLVLVAFLKFPLRAFLLAGLAVLLCTCAAFEYASFAEPSSFARRMFKMIIVICPTIIAVVVGLLLLNSLSPFVIGFFVGLTIFLCYCTLKGRSHLEDFSRTFASDGLAQLLIGGGGAALVGLSFSPQPVALIVLLVCVVAFNDSAAYFVGSRVGGPKLAPAISPKKTISGSIAGFVVGSLVGVLVGRAAGLGTNLQLTILSVQLVVAAQLGDLLKSYLKRLFGVKDSGNILPGHGGILDRIDGILGAAPLCLVWIELLR